MRFRNYGISLMQKAAYAPPSTGNAALDQLNLQRSQAANSGGVVNPGLFSLTGRASTSIVTDTTVIAYDVNGNPLNAEGQIIPGAPTVAPPGTTSGPPAVTDMVVVGYTQDGQGFPLNAEGQIVPGAASEYQATTVSQGNAAAGQQTLAAAAAASNQGQPALDAFWQSQPLATQQAAGYTPGTAPAAMIPPVPPLAWWQGSGPGGLSWLVLGGGAALAAGLGWFLLRKKAVST